MDLTVETVCNLLARSKLLPGDDVKKLYQAWQREAGPKVRDVPEFGKWLVSKQYVTQFQSDGLLRGHADHFFFNEYKLLDRIGKGKMAGVYKAVHRLGQVVAIKVLPASKAKDAETFGRFQREARLARRLNHPNVVRTFQVGQTGNLHYLVMEYLEGETLAEMLQRRGRLLPSEAAQLIYQALLGLHHIAEQGMVHRDLNPGNLMVLPPPKPGEPGIVKILDIGLGRATFEEGEEAANDVNLTREGTSLGSPDYMAPEQARSAHTADIRADIYGLGCVLYHCIAGQVPFAGKNAVQKMVKHASEAAAPLSSFNPAVSPALQQIVNTMMAKDPAQRYPTPAHAVQALKAILEVESGAAYAPQAAEIVPAYVSWLAAEAPLEVVALPAGAAAPVAIPVPAGSVPSNINVELVAVESPASGSRRTLILVLVGAAAALLLVLGGWGVMRLLSGG